MLFSNLTLPAMKFPYIVLQLMVDIKPASLLDCSPMKMEDYYF